MKRHHWQSLDMEEEDDKNRPKIPISRILSQAKPEKWLLLFATFSLLISSLVNLAIPQYLGLVIDSITDSTKTREEKTAALENAVFTLLILYPIGAIFTIIRGTLYTYVGEKVVTRLKIRLFTNLLQLDTSFFDSTPAGKLINRLSSDCTLIQSVVSSNFSVLVRQTVQLLGCLLILFVISWKLTLICMAVVPPIAIFAVIYSRYVRKKTRQLQDALAQSSAIADDALGHQSFVRENQTEAFEVDRYAHHNYLALNISKKVAFGFGSFIGTMSLLANCSLAFILWLGGSEVIQGTLSAGRLISFLLYVLFLGVSIASLANLFGEVNKALGASSRVFELIEKRPEVNIPIGYIPDQVKSEQNHSQPESNQHVASGILFRPWKPQKFNLVAGSELDGVLAAVEQRRDQLPKIFEQIYSFFSDTKSKESSFVNSDSFSPQTDTLPTNTSLSTDSTSPEPSNTAKTQPDVELANIKIPHQATLKSIPQQDSLNDYYSIAFPLKWKPNTYSGIAIEFCSVSFAYPSRPDVTVLRDINFTIPAGQFTALVGATGSGKSSIMGLISRKYLPTSGHILFNGVPLELLHPQWVLNQIAVVPQQTWLFTDTIRNNLLYGCTPPLPSQDELERVCKLAGNADEFIREIGGYDVSVGPGGVQLSVGQIQRILVARAILRDAPLNLWDEFSSALDAATEQRLTEALDQFRIGKTFIVVAHRLSTIIKADQILVIDSGKIVERGSHDHLLAANGFYKNLVQKQLVQDISV